MKKYLLMIVSLISFMGIDFVITHENSARAASNVTTITPANPVTNNPAMISNSSIQSVNSHINSSGSHALPQITNTPSQIMSDTDKKGLLSFYFQHIPVKTLIQIIAKESGLNFVISDGVKGEDTINLTNVTWNEALDIILKSRGLIARRIGNVMYIGTIEEITGNETRLLQAEQSIVNLEPLIASIIHLRYANAETLAGTLGAGSHQQDSGTVLSSRGQVAVDIRTNTIILREVKSNLAAVLNEIKALDVPARQVSIEARLVTINLDNEDDIGVQFGLTVPQHVSGTLQGANDLRSGDSPDEVPIAQRLNFNIPSSGVFSQSAGSIAMAVAHLGGSYIDMALSALEGQDNLQIVARPRIITSNLLKASIKAGTAIPYQQATSSGATSVTFVDAVLSLEITPQITPNNKIILNVKITQDKPSTATTAGVEIDEQQAESNVLLSNNETVVIGGVYRDSVEHQIERIPFFGTLPVVGRLFQHHTDSNNRTELLIFLTPMIIKSNGDFAKSELRAENQDFLTAQMDKSELRLNELKAEEAKKFNMRTVWDYKQ